MHLQFCFFRSEKSFYPLEILDCAEEDKAHILNRYFPGESLRKVSLDVSKPTRLIHQTLILKLFGYRNYSGDVVALVQAEATRLTAIHARPSYIVRELLRFFERERIVLPAYSTLQDFVGKAVQREITRLERVADRQLSQREKAALDDLLDILILFQITT